MENVIELRSVSKIYSTDNVKVPALSEVSLAIKKGDFVAIMGPSGSGKSTGMNMIGSLDIPTYGEIYLSGQNILKLEESALAVLRGRKVGFIFQGFNLISNLTAFDNVALPMIFRGLPRYERDERTKNLLNKVGLQKRMLHYPTQLSGGEMQRVAIARALANDPEIILADEPTGNLDSVRGEEIMKILEDLNKQGKTIVLVTHDKALAEKYAKTIYYLRDGRVVDVQGGRRKK